MAAPREETLAADAFGIYEAALAGVRPDRLIRGVQWLALLDRPLNAYRRTIVVAAGKAALPMASALEMELILSGALERSEGLIVVPRGYVDAGPSWLVPPTAWKVVEAGHPVPDGAGVRAAHRILALAESLGEEDLLIVLLSGGGSALLPAFTPGLPLSDARKTFRLMLASGADIHAMNTVRKHLSSIAGGRLAAEAFPARTVTLVISDVVGDEVGAVASGPTAPDPTTFADAGEVLRRFGLWNRVPASVRSVLDLGGLDPARDTPSPGDPRLALSEVRLVGTNRQALLSAAAEGVRRGYRVQVEGHATVGEAREVGRAQARRLAAGGYDVPVCLLWGGETTVTVRGRGRGGRNQEAALAAALELEGNSRDLLFLSAGTDGVDGPTDAAGAWVTPRTAGLARGRGVDPAAHLEENDSFSVLDAVGGLIRTGPTHTNVMDLQVGLAAP